MFECTSCCLEFRLVFIILTLVLWGLVLSIYFLLQDPSPCVLSNLTFRSNTYHVSIARLALLLPSHIWSHLRLCTNPCTLPYSNLLSRRLFHILLVQWIRGGARLYPTTASNVYLTCLYIWQMCIWVLTFYHLFSSWQPIEITYNKKDMLCPVHICYVSNAVNEP